MLFFTLKGAGRKFEFRYDKGIVNIYHVVIKQTICSHTPEFLLDKLDNLEEIGEIESYFTTYSGNFYIGNFSVLNHYEPHQLHKLIEDLRLRLELIKSV